MTATIMRKSVPLDEDDLDVLQRLGYDGSPEAIALHAVTGILATQDTSEAERLHALLVAGRRAIQEKVRETGYRRLAEFLKTDDESRRWRESRRARNTRRLAAEERNAT